jgi:hypothetical protein
MQRTEQATNCLKRAIFTRQILVACSPRLIFARELNKRRHFSKIYRK